MHIKKYQNTTTTLRLVDNKCRALVPHDYFEKSLFDEAHLPMKSRRLARNADIFSRQCRYKTLTSYALRCYMQRRYESARKVYKMALDMLLAPNSYMQYYVSQIEVDVLHFMYYYCCMELEMEIEECIVYYKSLLYKYIPIWPIVVCQLLRCFSMSQEYFDPIEIHQYIYILQIDFDYMLNNWPNLYYPGVEKFPLLENGINYVIILISGYASIFKDISDAFGASGEHMLIARMTNYFIDTYRTRCCPKYFLVSVLMESLNVSLNETIDEYIEFIEHKIRTNTLRKDPADFKITMEFLNRYRVEYKECHNVFMHHNDYCFTDKEKYRRFVCTEEDIVVPMGRLTELGAVIRTLKEYPHMERPADKKDFPLSTKSAPNAKKAHIHHTHHWLTKGRYGFRQGHKPHCVHVMGMHTQVLLSNLQREATKSEKVLEELQKYNANQIKIINNLKEDEKKLNAESLIISEQQIKEEKAKLEKLNQKHNRLKTECNSVFKKCSSMKADFEKLQKKAEKLEQIRKEKTTKLNKDKTKMSNIHAMFELKCKGFSSGSSENMFQDVENYFLRLKHRKEAMETTSNASTANSNSATKKISNKSVETAIKNKVVDKLPKVVIDSKTKSDLKQGNGMSKKDNEALLPKNKSIKLDVYQENWSNIKNKSKTNTSGTLKSAEVQDLVALNSYQENELEHDGKSKVESINSNKTCVKCKSREFSVETKTSLCQENNKRRFEISNKSTTNAALQSVYHDIRAVDDALYELLETYIPTSQDIRILDDSDLPDIELFDRPASPNEAFVTVNSSIFQPLHNYTKFELPNERNTSLSAVSPLPTELPDDCGSNYENQANQNDQFGNSSFPIFVPNMPPVPRMLQHPMHHSPMFSTTRYANPPIFRDLSFEPPIFHPPMITPSTFDPQRFQQPHFNSSGMEPSISNPPISVQPPKFTGDEPAFIPETTSITSNNINDIAVADNRSKNDVAPAQKSRGDNFQLAKCRRAKNTHHGLAQPRKQNPRINNINLLIDREPKSKVDISECSNGSNRARRAIKRKSTIEESDAPFMKMVHMFASAGGANTDALNNQQATKNVHELLNIMRFDCPTATVHDICEALTLVKNNCNGILNLLQTEIVERVRKFLQKQ